VSGVDASSSASLAAYINSLTYAIEDNIAWFSKPTAWKVRNGCYWYNNVSINIMVTAEFVEQLLQCILASRCTCRRQDTGRSARICRRSTWREVINIISYSKFGLYRGFLDRHTATPDIWQETYISALLRAILYSDDPSYHLDAYRKLDPISTPEDELRFLQAAEALFDKGKHWNSYAFSQILIAL